MERNWVVDAYDNIQQSNNEELDLYDENSQRAFWDDVIDFTTNIHGVLKEDNLNLNNPSTSTPSTDFVAASHSQFTSDSRDYQHYHDHSDNNDIHFSFNNHNQNDNHNDDNGRHSFHSSNAEDGYHDPFASFGFTFENLQHYDQTENLQHDDQTREIETSDGSHFYDKTFENLQQDDQTRETEPSDTIATKLYPHQKKALSWMIGKESQNTLPPFWEKHSGYFFNTLTYEKRQNVNSICGGILADDMGLGKSLEMISLIMTNFVDRKPLACLLSEIYQCENNIPSEYTKQKEATGCSQNMASIQSSCSPSDLKNEVVKETASYEASSSSSEPDLDDLIIFKPLPKLEKLEQSSSKFSSQKASSGIENPESAIKRAHVTVENETNDEHSPAKYGRLQEKWEDGEDLIDFEPSPELENLKHVEQGLSDLDPVIEISDCDSVITVHDSDESDADNIVSSRSGGDEDLLETIIPSWNSRNDCHKDIFLGYDPISGRCRTRGPRGTLIICPTSVLKNWENEFEKHIDQRVFLKIYVHYGKNRNTDVEFIKEQDVVITTYHTVIADNKKPNKGPLYNTEWLRIVLDEGHTIRNPKTSTAKLIFELKAQRKWVLSGTPIQNSMEDLWSIINFLNVEPLNDKRVWNRTIAIPLGNKNDNVSQRIFHLMRNLCLRRTKTQVVNGKPILDLPARNIVLKKLTLDQDQRKTYDLLEKEGRILISTYIKNNTVQKHLYEIFIVQLRLRQYCCHPKLVIKAEVGQSQKDTDSSSDAKVCIQPGERESSTLMQQGVICSSCLSAPKNAVISSNGLIYCWTCIQVNPVNAQNQVNESTHEEFNLAQMKSLKDQLNSAINIDECIVCTNSLNDGVITSRGHVYCKNCFQNNPEITQAYETISSAKRKNLIGKLLMWLDMDEENKECPICFTKTTEISHKKAVITFCGHQFCSHCIEKLCRSQPQPSCPMCRQQIDRIKLIKIPSKLTEGSDSIDGWNSSAKLNALMTALNELHHTDPSIKSIVVSQFTSLLDLIEKALREQNFIFTRLDGRMSQRKRNDAMKIFSETSLGSPTVFLLSLKAGGVGINLTAASRVFLMEPAWNPASEEQCFDRCHRLGQTRDIEITKFIIENSVEENMLKLQEKKRGLMTGAFVQKLSKEQKRNNYISDLLDFFNDLR